MAVNKVVLMITVMVVLSLGTLPAPLAATRFDIAGLLAATDNPTGKIGDSSWCSACACTFSIPPYCQCSDASLCTKCVCYITLSAALKPLCETDTIASKFDKYCPSSSMVAEKGSKISLS